MLTIELLNKALQKNYKVRRVMTQMKCITTMLFYCQKLCEMINFAGKKRVSLNKSRGLSLGSARRAPHIISDGRNKKTNEFVFEKVRNRLTSWKINLLFMIDRLITLINSVPTGYCYPCWQLTLDISHAIEKHTEVATNKWYSWCMI